MKKNFDLGRIILGTWAQLCLEDVEHWTPDLQEWAIENNCYPTGSTVLKYARLAEYLVSRMPMQYGYLLDDRNRARLREIFQFRLKQEGGKILGTPAEEWMAAFQATQFLFLYQGDQIRRIGESGSDPVILSSVVNGFFNPIDSFPPDIYS